MDNFYFFFSAQMCVDFSVIANTFFHTLCARHTNLRETFLKTCKKKTHTHNIHVGKTLRNRVNLCFGP